MIPMLIAGGLAAYSAYQGKKASDKQQKASDAALQFEKEKWAQGQGFRDQGKALLSRRLDPNAITNAFADPGNPYAQGNTYQSPWMAEPAAEPPRTAQPRGSGVAQWARGRLQAGGAPPRMDEGEEGSGADMMARRARLGAVAGMLR